ncbi:aldo/keto reductase [Dyadobacter sp. 3J3]|uniref:aldo/keto reductase n=1 Tax=Dyadobacter sp. 3J3 TaxID=2606600 RepID=UPI00190F583F|nr:aldo/keto reductase [Dyadobacter sp. 3J3]
MAVRCSRKEEKPAGKHYDYSSAYIIWSVEQSLRNLRTDYLDLLLLHRPSPLMKSDEIAEAIEKLKGDVKILEV